MERMENREWSMAYFYFIERNTFTGVLDQTSNIGTDNRTLPCIYITVVCIGIIMHLISYNFKTL